MSDFSAVIIKPYLLLNLHASDWPHSQVGCRFEQDDPVGRGVSYWYYEPDTNTNTTLRKEQNYGKAWDIYTKI